MKRTDAAEWADECKKEFQSLIDKGVITLVRRSDLKPGTPVLPSQWVFRVKLLAAGDKDKKKSRPVVGGHKQEAGINFSWDNIFASTGKYKSMRVGLSYAAKHDYEIDQIDIKFAFLNAPIDDEIYMQILPGFREGSDGYVVKLNKALYGLKQAPRAWQRTVSAFIINKMEFKQTVSDPCVFYKISQSGKLIYMFLFVDDFQVSYHISDRPEWYQLKSLLMKEFEAVDVGPTKMILGMRLVRDRKLRTIKLDQELKIVEKLEYFGLDGSKPYSTPEVNISDNSPHTGTNSIPNDKDGAGIPTDKQRYMEIVGSLIYFSISTRPDISHAVHVLSTKLQNPVRRDMIAAERCLRYLSGTRTLGLVFGANSSGTDNTMNVIAYGDADYANNRADRKSITGWLMKLNGDPISWKCKKQSVVSQSTTEAELYATGEAIKEAKWMEGMLDELKINHQPSIIYNDNKSTIFVCRNGIKTSEPLKHIHVKWCFINDEINEGNVRLDYLDTENQLADIFTKALQRPRYEMLRDQLVM